MKAILAILALGVVAAMATPVQEVRFEYKPLACDPEHIEGKDFNISLSPVAALNEGSSHGGMDLAGHSGLVAEVNIIIITLTATFEVDLPSLDVAIVDADVSGYVDTRPFTSLPVGNYTGTGAALVKIENLRVTGSATLFINIIGNKVNIRILNVDVFSFSTLCLDFGPDFLIGGVNPDWVDFCANFKTRFDTEWANNNLKNALVEKIRAAGNNIVGQYTLEELLDLLNPAPSTGEPGTEAPCTL